MAGGVAQVLVWSPEFKPQYCQKQQQKLLKPYAKQKKTNNWENKLRKRKGLLGTESGRLSARPIGPIALGLLGGGQWGKESLAEKTSTKVGHERENETSIPQSPWEHASMG
jgi:hypothetical protein